MVGWHHRLEGHEFEQAPGVGEGQGSLACCSPWGRQESVTQLCLILCDPMGYSMPGFPVLHQLLELAQTIVHWVGDAIQISHFLLAPSPPAFYLSQHQSLFQWAGSLHQVAKVLELQHQSFQRIFRVDFFRIDWLDLLSVQGTLKSLLQHHSSKVSIFQCSAFFMVQLSHLSWLLGKP